MTRIARFVLPLLAVAAIAAPARAEQKPDKPAIKPFETAQLAPNAWYGRFGATNCAWLELEDGVLLVDTGGNATDTANLLSEVKRTTKGKPVKWAVLTHLHQDSNGGLLGIFPADVTLYVNRKVAQVTANAIAKKETPEKHVVVVGVADRLLVMFGTHPFELFVPKSSANSETDLVAYFPELRMEFVGDFVTPGRCPIMTDPAADPKAWLEVLDNILALKPVVLVPSRGDAAVRRSDTWLQGLDLDAEVTATRHYIERVTKTLLEKKKAGAPEADVTATLRLSRNDYCPLDLDAANGLALYRRLTPTGEYVPASPVAPKASAPKKK